MKQIKKQKTPKISKQPKGLFKSKNVKDLQQKKTIKDVFTPKGIGKKYIGMTIYKKLSISFMVVALVSSIIIGTVGVISLGRANNISQEIYNEDLVTLSPLYRIETDFLSMKAKINGGDVWSNQSAISTLTSDLNTELSKYSKTVTDTKERSGHQ